MVHVSISFGLLTGLSLIAVVFTLFHNQ